MSPDLTSASAAVESLRQDLTTMGRKKKTAQEMLKLTKASNAKFVAHAKKLEETLRDKIVELESARKTNQEDAKTVLSECNQKLNELEEMVELATFQKQELSRQLEHECNMSPKAKVINLVERLSIETNNFRAMAPKEIWISDQNEPASTCTPLMDTSKNLLAWIKPLIRPDAMVQNWVLQILSAETKQRHQGKFLISAAKFSMTPEGPDSTPSSPELSEVPASAPLEEKGGSNDKHVAVGNATNDMAADVVGLAVAAGGEPAPPEVEAGSNSRLAAAEAATKGRGGNKNGDRCAVAGAFAFEDHVPTPSSPTAAAVTGAAAPATAALRSDEIDLNEVLEKRLNVVTKKAKGIEADGIVCIEHLNRATEKNAILEKTCVFIVTLSLCIVFYLMKKVRKGQVLRNFIIQHLNQIRHEDFVNVLSDN